MSLNSSWWSRINLEHPYPNDVARCLIDLRSEVEEQSKELDKLKQEVQDMKENR